MLARPLISGVAFGIFVMISMQLGEVLTNIYALPNSYTLLNAFIAHVFFFGIPVAYIVTRFETA
jgi:putative Mn2+ efflux pump MntP